MTTRNLLRLFSKTLGVVIALAVTQKSSLEAASFRSVLKDPRAYQHQRVSIVGVVRGDGPQFEFYVNGSDAQKAAKASKTILVVAPANWKGKGPYDMRQVRVTGIVEAARHGFWGNRCEILLEKIEVISGPVAPWRTPFGVFRNEGTKTVLVRLFGPTGIQAKFGLGPTDSIELPISDGTIKIFSLEDALIVEDKIVARPAPPFFDTTNAASYYRITNKKIEKVLPSIAKAWGWRR